MSSTSDAFTDDKKKEILQTYNDKLHDAVKLGKYTMIVEHDLTDPRKFTIIKDVMYDGNLEGVNLIFEDPEKFKEKFPAYFQLPPVHIPTNTERNTKTGKLQGIKKDPIPIESISELPGQQYMIKLAETSADVGCIWLKSFLQVPGVTISIYTSLEEKGPYNIIPHLKNISAVNPDNPEDQKFIPFNTTLNNETITTNYILIVIHDKSLTYIPEIKVKVTRASAIV